MINELIVGSDIKKDWLLSALDEEKRRLCEKMKINMDDYSYDELNQVLLDNLKEYFAKKDKNYTRDSILRAGAIVGGILALSAISLELGEYGKWLTLPVLSIILFTTVYHNDKQPNIEFIEDCLLHVANIETLLKDGKTQEAEYYLKHIKFIFTEHNPFFEDDSNFDKFNVKECTKHQFVLGKRTR